MPLTTLQILIIATVGSIAYQIQQTKIAKKKAERAKEARRGYETVTEAEIISLPIVYGRAKIGGVRSWIATASSLNFNGNHNSQVVIGSIPSGPVTGSKNEYLVFQQALCQGPINTFRDVIVDDTFNYDETDFKSLHIECHTNGGSNNNVFNNFSERLNATFKGIAYANAFVKIDRDNPRDIPDLQFFIEGRKIRSITKTGNTYTVNSTRTYSNNPAYCLLDYLLEDNSEPILNISTKALKQDDIDLESFYNAAQVCSRIVQSPVNVGGKVWQSSTGSINQYTRALPLYECNIIIDTAKPIRENIEGILSTMGDARLIWSGGKYKLSLQYPGGS